MNRRRLLKALKRIRHLPGGIAFFRYTFNKLRQLLLNASGSTRVAHPSTIMLELSAHCNLHCSICPREYEYGKQMDQGFMPPDKAMEIIDRAWPYLDSIGLTGMGETFLYPHLEQVACHIRSRNPGIVISVSTNACAPRTIELTTRLRNKIDTLQVSVDGLGATYEKIRKGSSFQLFSSNLHQMAKILQGSQTDLMLNMVVTHENFEQMAAMVDFAAANSIPYLNFTLLNLAAVTELDVSYYQLFYSEEFIRAKNILQEAKTRQPGVEVSFWQQQQPGKGFRNCPFPWTHFYISWNGNIPPCCAKPFPKQFHFGNIFDIPLTQILNTSTYRHFRRLWQQDQTPSFCNKCHFIDL